MSPDTTILLNAVTYVLVTLVAFKTGRDWDELAGSVRRRRRRAYRIREERRYERRRKQFQRKAGCQGMTTKEFELFMDLMINQRDVKA